MGVYRVVYTDKSRILSCSEISEKVPHEIPYFQHEKGKLNFAIIEASNESQARSIAKYIALELSQQIRLQELKNRISDK